LSKKESSGEVIKIPCGYEISLNNLVKKINKILDTSITPVYEKERKGDVKHSIADISKAKNLLGYEPTTSFEEGLKKTIEIMKGV
jgi:UDP-glucose 4-epimerase